ncbi:MAG: lectin-like domain-containing protein [Flavisolibacter sp.]
MRKLFTFLILPFLFVLNLKAQYVTNGTAVPLGPNEYQLTRETVNQGGSVWYQVRLDLRYDFTINSQLNLGRLDPGGADGIAFVLQPINVNQGASGGGIGYAGIIPSLAVEFDTWMNPEFHDPPQDHMAFMRNGDNRHLPPNNPDPPFILPNIEDGLYHDARFSWNAATHMLTVNFLGFVRTFNEDIINTIFAGDPYVYWGFTGATGAAINDQRVIIGPTSFVEEINIPGTVTNTSCPSSSDGAVDISPTGGLPPYTFVWSNGATTEDISGVPANDYTVVVTDQAGVSKSASFTVGSNPDNTPPDLRCPGSQLFCFNSTGNYFIPLLVENDNCGIQSTKFVITGTTSRFGSGPNASGPFNPGMSTITWTVLDVNGNTSSCSTQVTVDPQIIGNIPDVYAVSPGGAANTIYLGYGPSSLTLTVMPSGGTSPYSFSWSTGDHTQSTTVSPSVPGNYIYMVKVQDANGCLILVSKTVHVVDARCGNKNEKVMVCHIPPGDPANSHVICVSPNAVPAHLTEHGDMLVSCEIESLSQKHINVLDIPSLRQGIFPNPTKGRFELVPSVELKGNVVVLILNESGTVVERRNISISKGQSIRLDLSNRASGLYLVKLISPSGTQTEKIVVER